ARAANEKYNKKSGWTAAGGGYVGTIDNGGTYSHMALIANAYQITKDAKYKQSFDLAMQFIKNLQTPNGGFAQVYPKRGNYSDFVTINDDAMVNVMLMLEQIYKNNKPYTDMLTEAERSEVKAMYDRGIDFFLKAQIVVDGVKTGWCAQHNATTYAPEAAREYERPSISGSESMGVIYLLINHEDKTCKDAALAALRWFDSVKLVNSAYDANGVYNSATGKTEYIYYKEGKNLWFRFYDLQGRGFYSDRKSNSKWSAYNGYFYDITEISAERRTGYAWMGTWPQNYINKYLK
ncbi:MAG: pectate lyase, partial [Clostridia bacterium]|nr:pectate lyase [Clostridia bacterium]